MLAKRNLRLITPYLVFTLEGVCHGVYLLWLTVHKGISPIAAAAAIIVPASMIGTLSSIGELIAQTTPREGMGAGLVAMVIAGGIALEALGSFLVARGWVPITQRVLDLLGIGAIAGLVAVALAPVALLPALLFIFLASGTAPAIRSALVQRQAREGERATAASACSALDMIGKTAGLPLGAWLSGHTRLAETALILGLTAILTWAPARGRLAS